MPAKTNNAKLDPSLILRDTKNFSDDIEITLPNGAVMTLGDMRAYDAATQGSVQAELERGRQALAEERKKVEAASTSVAQMYVELEKQKQALESRATTVASKVERDELEDVLSADPVYARLSKTINTLQERLDAQQKKIDDGFSNVTNTLNTVGSTYLQERYQRDFDDLLKRDDPARPKDLSLDHLYKYASDNGIKNRNGILDLNRAYDQMTSSKRNELAIQKAREEGAQAERERLQREAALPHRPTNGMNIPGLDKVINGHAAPKNLDEAFAAAANDPSIWGASH